jgi:hypothetical protein
MRLGQPAEAYTYGWYMTVAHMGRSLPSLQVFLDRSAGPGGRCFWFGFGASNNRKQVDVGRLALWKPRISIGSRRVGTIV